MNKNYTPLVIDQFKKNYSSFNKEVEPLVKKESFPIKEKVEHEIEDKEVASYIKIRPETIKLPEKIKQLGGQTKFTTSKFASYQSVNLPISDEKVVVGLKAPITSSFRWLATLAVYILKMAHLQLKVVKGKIVRVFSP